MHSFSSFHLKPAIACVCLMLGAAAETIDIDAAIRQLGSESYADRESATKSLWSAGKSAQAALNRALKDKDLEVRVRAQFILERLKLGLRPDSTPEEIAHVQQFRYGNSHEKIQLVRELIRKGAKNQDKIPDWIETVPSENERASLYRSFEQVVLQSLNLFLTQNKKKQTQNLLKLCLDSGHSPVARHAAAYYLQKGELPAKIAELQKSDSAKSKRALALMLRAAGDMEKARDAAKESGDHRLLRDLLLEMNDWAALAELNDVMNVPDSVNDDRLMQIVFNWMAGKTDAFEKDCNWLQEQAKRLPNIGTSWYAVEVFLITSRLETAEELLKEKKNFLRAMEIRFAAHDLKGAFELFEKGLEPKTPYLFRHRLTGARLYAIAGKLKKAEEIFNALVNEMKKPYSTMYQIVGMEIKAGLRSLALTHTAQAMAAMRSTHQRRVLFIQLWTGREVEAEDWWNMLKKSSPKDSPIQLLTKMDSLLQPGMEQENAPVDLWEFTVSFEKVKDKNKIRQASQRYAIARAFARHAVPVEARKQMEAVIKLYPAHSNALLYLTRDAAKKPDWSAAAGYLAKIRRNNSPHYEYLYGYALDRSGKADAGKKIMEKAKLLMFGDELKRSLLIAELRRCGLEEEARRQEDITVRTGQFMSQYIGQVLRSRAEEAIDKGDYKTAAQYWERAMIRPVKRMHSFVETSGYMLVPQYVHTYWACHLVQEGKIEEAMNRAEQCFNFHPGGIDLAIHLVPLLESAGRKEEADLIFTRSFNSLRTVLESYPDSAQFRNQAAWMSAKCKRELDTALADSTHAVKLRPNSSAYIDTLAEVQFVQGKTDEAIKTSRRALQLEPDKDYYQKQLKRFLKAKDK